MALLLNPGAMQEVAHVAHEEMFHYPEVARKGRRNKNLRNASGTKLNYSNQE